MNSSKQSNYETLRQWLLSLPRNAYGPELDTETDIIETGILDSLEFVNFLMLIEELRGSEVPSDLISLDAFRTLAHITRTFLEEPDYAD